MKKLVQIFEFQTIQFEITKEDIFLNHLIVAVIIINKHAIYLYIHKDVSVVYKAIRLFPFKFWHNLIKYLQDDCLYLKS